MTIPSSFCGRLLALALACSATTGCIPLGRQTHLVVGLGLVKARSTNATEVIQARTLGFYAGDRRWTLGLSSLTATYVPTNANAVLELQ